jgi:hypothetical protein
MRQRFSGDEKEKNRRETQHAHTVSAKPNTHILTHRRKAYKANTTTIQTQQRYEHNNDTKTYLQQLVHDFVTELCQIAVQGTRNVADDAGGDRAHLIG